MTTLVLRIIVSLIILFSQTISTVTLVVTLLAVAQVTAFYIRHQLIIKEENFFHNQRGNIIQIRPRIINNNNNNNINNPIVGGPQSVFILRSSTLLYRNYYRITSSSS